MSYSQEQLTAYLDGELPNAESQALEAELANNPALCVQLEELAIDRPAIASAFDQLLATAPPMPDLAALQDSIAEPAPAPLPVPANDNFVSLRMLIASSFVAVCLGVGVTLGLSGGFGGQKQQPGWIDFVASYQALYVPETLTNVKTDTATLEAETARAAHALSRSLNVAQLESLQGLDFKRAQVLGFKGKPLVQLAFLSDSGEPVALCIIKANGAADEAMAPKTLQGMEAASWSKGGFKYLLIGGQDKALINRAAREFNARM